MKCLIVFLLVIVTCKAFSQNEFRVVLHDRKTATGIEGGTVTTKEGIFTTDEYGGVVINSQWKKLKADIHAPGFIDKQADLSVKEQVSHIYLDRDIPYHDSLDEAEFRLKQKTWKEADAVYENDTVPRDTNCQFSSAAEFPGGMTEMNKFLSRNMEYPDFAFETGITGKVYLKFIVEKDGTVTNVQALRSPHSSLTRSAITIMRAMPKWIPAKCDGKGVRSYYQLPLNFNLQ